MKPVSEYLLLAGMAGFIVIVQVLALTIRREWEYLCEVAMHDLCAICIGSEEI